MFATVVHGYQNFSAPPGGTLVAIGNFDGVHLGHRALIEHAYAEAHAQALLPVAMTFHPHPATVLSNVAPLPLTTTPRKIELLLRLFPELNIIVQPFDAAFSQIEAERFVGDILLGALGARYVLVGSNFHFGRGRRGNEGLLRSLAVELGFLAQAFELSGDGVGEYSSSRVRAELVAGRLDNVTRMLGRPHSISGVVAPGDRRGRTLGFPTANLEQVEEGLPPAGVYTGVVDEISETRAPVRLGLAVMSIGPRPTVARDHAVEVHLLDYAADLYGKRLRVHLIQHLRGIEQFASLAQLQLQIEADVATAREQLARWMPTNSATLV